MKNHSKIKLDRHTLSHIRNNDLVQRTSKPFELSDTYFDKDHIAAWIYYQDVFCGREFKGRVITADDKAFFAEGFSCAGIIWINKADVREALKVKRISAKRVDIVKKILINRVGEVLGKYQWV